MKHIFDYLAEHATKQPEKIAISDEFGAYTYRELDGLSSAIATELLKKGVNRGDSVAVYVPYVKELVLGTFAAMRSGGVYVPMEYSYPDDRIRYMLENSSAKVILTLHSVWEKRPFEFPSDKVIFMDDEYENVASVSVDTEESEPAMILYTSGTTGRPKGVVIPQNMMVHLLDWAFIHEGTQLTENSKAGIVSGLTFSATTLILYSPFVFGGTVILASEYERKDMDRLYAFLKENGITHTFLSAGLATTMAEHYDMSDINVFAGGEKLRNFHSVSPRARIINTYGCTELGAVISGMIRGDEDIIPVGLLSPDTKSMIVDANLCAIGHGEVGELVVRNERMAKGYLGLPEQTAAKWVEIGGEIWFRTGDRARCDESGIYYILGRTDNMVKIRGFRVETGEVEAQISRIAEKLGIVFRNCVVTVRNVNGIDHLTCYYESSEEADTSRITQEISEVLASYMIPDIWVRVDTMPRNANGKIIRASLPQPKTVASSVGVLYSEAEARVVEAVGYVLGIRSYLSPDDSFISLGGTSLKAMELSTQLREMGIEISTTLILKSNSLREIAGEAKITYEHFWSAEEYERVRADYASRGEKIEKVLPITSQQDEALFEMLIHPDRRGSRRILMLQIDSILTQAELRNALDEAALKYEHLRSSIVFHGTSVIQQVITNRKIPLEMIEFQKNDTRSLKDIYNLLMLKTCDFQSESNFRAVCVHKAEQSFLYILDFMGQINTPMMREYVACIMKLLYKNHPEDESILEWIDLLEMNLGSTEEKESGKSAKEIINRNASICESDFKEIYTYSENHKKKLVFVHTGNTASEAYYSLAERIKNDYSFAVIEPFNLYHINEATYGIQNIALRYVQTLKKYQPEGPYILGGWCYGGIVAHEMACQLREAGEQVELLILLDSHVTEGKMREIARDMHSSTGREYFETADLFKDMREHGMVDALVENMKHVGHDMVEHVPKYFDGPCLYFKPQEIPEAASGQSLNYWKSMKDDYIAGGYENYCNRAKLTVIETPHEHDLMMDSESLDIIVPNIYFHCK